jgi:DNA-binding transcriptional LysR family regulator
MDPASDLYLFSQIVNNGSFVSAAKQLKMTPSGVSKRLSRFEQRLQVRLFNRTTRTLALTESGQALFDRAQAILDAIEDAETQTRELSRVPRGRLRVACSDAFALHVIMTMLRRFSNEFPEVAVTLIQGDGPLDLLAEQVDLAIRFERPTNLSFVATKLIEDPWVVCASPGYLDEYGTPALPTDLVEHRCVTIQAKQDETNTWEFRQGDRIESVTLNSTFSGIGLVVKAAAMEGLGIARLANFLVATELENGSLVQLLPDYQTATGRSIYAVYPNKEFLPLKVRVFIDALKRAMDSRN